MPRWLSALRVALRSLVYRRRLNDELDEEMQDHLERQIDAGVKAGLTAVEARYAALRKMGPVTQSKEASRDLRPGARLAEFFGDLRYAARALRRTPGFAFLAIAIMALGIGANTAVFSVVNGVLLKPLPYPDADRVVALRTAALTTGQINPLIVLANFRDWREQSTSFEAMASYRGGEAPVTPGDAAEYARHAIVDVQLFRVLGIEPAVGRVFVPEDAIPGTSQPVALISHGYWQTRFGGERDILKRTLRVGSNPRVIVGVMPPDFQFPNRTDVWTPQLLTPTTNRTSHNSLGVARLKPGLSIDAAQLELNTIAARLEQLYPDSNKGRGVSLVRLQDVTVGNVRFTLYLLWGVVGVVLLIACANTATLLLGNAVSRTGEITVRAALGASRARLMRQLVTEGLLLSLIAGTVGIALAYWGVQVLVTLMRDDVIRLTDTGLDARVLVFTLAASVVTSLLFGLVPAFHASRVDLVGAMKLGGGRAAMGRRVARARGALVVGEIALAVVLVTGAGLLLRSLLELQKVNLGFQPENVLVMRATGVRSPTDNNRFFATLLPRIEALPGVVAVGATSIPPGELSYSGDGSYFIDHVPEPRDRNRDPRALFTIVAPGAFAALGIPVKHGRDFNGGDTAESPLVAIVNDALVRQALPGQNPIGRTIFCSWDRKGGMTIVGVVGDVRQRDPALEPMPDCYMPYTQHNYNGNTLMLVTRTVGDPMALSGSVRGVAAEIAPDVPVSFTTMEATVSRRVEEPRFRAFLLAAFAALAVCLAMVGVYGVMSHAVSQRSQEIGLRVALGASPADVRRSVLRDALWRIALGVGIGLVVAFATSSLFTAFVFGIQPTDPVVYISVAALLAAVGFAAAIVPAQRAAGLDPLVAMRRD
jgi:predicted permease